MQTIKSEEAPKAAPAGAAKEVELPQGGDKEAKEVTDATEEKTRNPQRPMWPWRHPQ